MKVKKAKFLVFTSFWVITNIILYFLPQRTFLLPIVVLYNMKLFSLLSLVIHCKYWFGERDLVNLWTIWNVIVFIFTTFTEINPIRNYLHCPATKRSALKTIYICTHLQLVHIYKNRFILQNRKIWCSLLVFLRIVIINIISSVDPCDRWKRERKWKICYFPIEEILEIYLILFLFFRYPTDNFGRSVIATTTQLDSTTRAAVAAVVHWKKCTPASS